MTLKALVTPRGVARLVTPRGVARWVRTHSHILTPPNSPSPGVMVAMAEMRGAPIELMQIDHELRPDL